MFEVLGEVQFEAIGQLGSGVNNARAVSIFAFGFMMNL